jgi:hypothetical protein
MEHPGPTEAIGRTLEILQERGWSRKWSSGKGSTLNIRSAISVACTDLAGSQPSTQWSDLYINSVDVLTQHLKKGVTDWEFTVKSPAEVEQMLATVIIRLENDEIRPRRRLHRTGTV